jgi:AraC-like DNA-binding protein
MERFPVFHSRDPEETRAFLEEKQFRFDMAPRQMRELGSQLNGVYLPSMYLGYIEYGGAAVATTATSGRSDYWIQISLRGNIEVAAGREIIGCDAAHAALTSPKREPTVRSGPGSARFHVSLTEAALIRQLAALLGEPVVSPLEFASGIPTAVGYGRSLVEALYLAAADVQRESALLANPLTLSTFEQFVLTGLLLSQPHNYRDALQRRAKPVAPADVRRAIDFIEANVDAAIGLPDIVAASGIPGRTLLKHFRDFRGTSPMRYLRHARFERVHRALRAAAAEDGVTQIALAHGFTHMGRFSVEYQRQFGESPSVTLRRRPR